MLHPSPGGLCVELQWRWSSLRSPRSAPEDWFWEAPVEVQLGKGQTVRTPSPESYLLLLCQHGAGHRWNKLQWIMDIVQLVRRHPIDWSRVATWSRRLGCQRPLALGLLLARELGAAVPPLPEMECPAVCKEAQWIGSRALQQEPVAMALRDKLFDLRMRPDGRARLEYLLSLALVPAHDDLGSLRLVGPWVGLYLVWRPLHQLLRLLQGAAHRLGFPCGAPRTGKEMAAFRPPR